MNLSNELIHFSETVSKLRNRESVTIFEHHSKIFYRFRINTEEKRLFWIKEASLDRRNWVAQNHFLGLKDVLMMIHRNKVNNLLHRS